MKRVCRVLQLLLVGLVAASGLIACAADVVDESAAGSSEVRASAQALSPQAAVYEWGANKPLAFNTKLPYFKLVFSGQGGQNENPLLGFKLRVCTTSWDLEADPAAGPWLEKQGPGEGVTAMEGVHVTRELDVWRDGDPTYAIACDNVYITIDSPGWPTAIASNVFQRAWYKVRPGGTVYSWDRQWMTLVEPYTSDGSPIVYTNGAPGTTTYAPLM